MSAAQDSNTPTQPPHGGALRGLLLTPSSSTTTGRFGRMFRHVPVYEHDPKTLVALAATMIQPSEPDKPLITDEEDKDQNESTLDGELRLPAGYTYFGQFVDHDITFDPVSSLTRQNDPDALTDFRTPRFDLDSLYGGGPANQPYLYQQPDGVKLELGERRSDKPEFDGPDLPRGPNSRALIGDPRNDENLIVSQLQVAFIKFHNAVVDHVRLEPKNRSLDHDELFKLAQQTVRWHYQWVVIHDFLRRLVGRDVIDDILRGEVYLAPSGADEAGKQKKGYQLMISPHLLFYSWRERPFMPVEFSVAAYRFGHSMIRPSYLINDLVKPAVRDAERIPLFHQGGDDDLVVPPPAHGLRDLRGFGRLPEDAGVQWKYFLPIEHPKWPNEDGLPQPSYRIDTELSHPLGELPGTAPLLLADVDRAEAKSLAGRNLLRGRALGLPAGQDVARAMGIPPLTDDELLGDVEFNTELLADLKITEDEVRADLAGRAPLWFYILKEADCKAEGAHLGPVGGRIVAEVLIGLLVGDPLSYLSVDPTWRPNRDPETDLPGKTPATFTLTDIINVGLEAERGRST